MIEYLKDIPKRKPSKRYSIDIDGFIYYIKKETNFKTLKTDIYSVYHYPSGYLLFGLRVFKTDKPIDVLQRKVLKDHVKAVKLLKDYIQEQKKKSIFQCIGE